MQFHPSGASTLAQQAAEPDIKEWASNISVQVSRFSPFVIEVWTVRHSNIYVQIHLLCAHIGNVAPWCQVWELFREIGGHGSPEKHLDLHIHSKIVQLYMLSPSYLFAFETGSCPFISLSVNSLFPLLPSSLPLLNHCPAGVTREELQRKSSLWHFTCYHLKNSTEAIYQMMSGDEGNRTDLC